MKSKKLYRLLLIIMAVFLMTTILSACGNKAENAQKSNTSNNSASDFPLTVKDAGGFETIIKEKPVKIVSLTLGTDEMLLDMVDKSRIASLTPYADDPGVSNIAGKVKDISTRLTSESEKILAVKPDLVITDTWASADFIKQLRNAKVAVYVIKTPSNIDEQKNVIMEIAHVVGEVKKGEEIVAWMDSKLAAVNEKIGTLKEEQKLTVMDYSEMGSTSGKGTNFDDIMKRAGLINVASRAGLEGWPNLSKEKIVEWNPEIILIPSWYYDKSKDSSTLGALIKNDKALSVVKAIKENKIISIPYKHVSAISQYVVLGVEDAARVAYPELFK